MTTVSGTTSTSSTSSTTTLTGVAAAQASLKTLLISQGMLTSLDTNGTTSTAPTPKAVLSTLWSVFDASGNNTITKSDVQKAVTNLGGSASDATAIWSQISPHGINKVTEASFNSNSFLTSTINTNIATIRSSFSSFTSSSAGIAANTMSKLITSNDVVQALAAESSTYVPPTTNQIVSTVFALFNANSTKAITENDVQKAILGEGGTISGAKAVWSQLSPTGASSINASQFVTSAFVTSAVTANTQAVQATAAKIQLISTGTSGSILDKFSSSGADILAGAMGGYNDSPVGGGGYINYTNLFV